MFARLYRNGDKAFNTAGPGGERSTACLATSEKISCEFRVLLHEQRVRSPLQPKSDISDLGQLIVPNSGEPEFGRGKVGAEGAG
jgi:hypothetical protein